MFELIVSFQKVQSLFVYISYLRLVMLDAR